MKTTNGAYIIDSLNKILVCHPTNHSMNMWSIPKGLTDEGETSLESTNREVWEETDLNLDLFKNKTTYKDLGIQPYNNKKKKLHAHLFHIDLPLSKMELNLWCKSNFICEKSGIEYPENDITRWESFEFSEKYLHESQQTFLKKVMEIVSNIKNK